MFISTSVMSLLKRHDNHSIFRLKKAEAPTLFANSHFREEVEIVHRAVRNISSAVPVLTDSAIGSHYINKLAAYSQRALINGAFVSRVPRNTTLARDVVKQVSNGTASIGDSFAWIGGEASMFTVGRSRVSVVVQSCSSLLMFDKDRKFINAFSFQFVRSAPPFKSVLLSMGPPNSAISCGGNGIIFKDHGQFSQRVWRIASGNNENGRDTVGHIRATDLNDGNNLISISDEQLDMLRRHQDETAGVASTHRGQLTNGFISVQHEYERGLEQYNNMAFLILSLAAILSSTAIASMAPGKDSDRISIVVVESCVVYSFLAIVAHACVVFTRAETFLVDSKTVIRGNYTYNEAILGSRFELHLSAIGERMELPRYLLITTVCSFFAALIVTVTAANLARRVWKQKKRRPFTSSAVTDASVGAFSSVENIDYWSPYLSRISREFTK